MNIERSLKFENDLQELIDKAERMILDYDPDNKQELLGFYLELESFHLRLKTFMELIPCPELSFHFEQLGNYVSIFKEMAVGSDKKINFVFEEATAGFKFEVLVDKNGKRKAA